MYYKYFVFIIQYLYYTESNEDEINEEDKEHILDINTYIIILNSGVFWVIFRGMSNI
jgi:hypothetical protein